METDDSQASVLCYFTGILKTTTCPYTYWPDVAVYDFYCVLTFIDIDECASGPCQNGGTCVDQVNGYQCQCSPGYTDLQCHTGKGTDQLKRNASVPHFWLLRLHIYFSLCPILRGSFEASVSRHKYFGFQFNCEEFNPFQT